MTRACIGGPSVLITQYSWPPLHLYSRDYLCYGSCRKDIMRRGVNSSFNDTDTDSWKNSLSRWLGFLNLSWACVRVCAVYVCKAEKKLHSEWEDVSTNAQRIFMKNATTIAAAEQQNPVHWFPVFYYGQNANGRRLYRRNDDGRSYAYNNNNIIIIPKGPWPAFVVPFVLHTTQEKVNSVGYDILCVCVRSSSKFPCAHTELSSAVYAFVL